jgi:hypothetical protein
MRISDFRLLIDDLKSLFNSGSIPFFQGEWLLMKENQWGKAVF